MADMKKLLHTFDEADELLNGKIERTNLSTIVASATASVENKNTVLIRGTGRNIESLKVGGRTVQDGVPTPDAPVEVKGVGDYDEETGKYKIPVSCGEETTNIYLDAPLFDGEVADLVGGKAEKKWGMVNLEDISWEIEGNYWIGRTPVGFKKAASPDVPFSGYCSTFKIVAINPLSASMTALAVSTAGNMFYVSNQSKTDKPVGILVYELINSVSESFDGTDIPTTAAEQEVNINTELVPSSIEAVTFGDYYSKAEVDKMMGNSEIVKVTNKIFVNKCGNQITIVSDGATDVTEFNDNVLPKGYRPSMNVRIPIMINNVGAGFIMILTTGVMTVFNSNIEKVETGNCICSATFI